MRFHLTEKDFVRRPWKNLRGSTLEILKWPRSSQDDFLFRLSQADLTESGPFSFFPGIDRILILTEGPPVTLNETHLPLWKPFSFPGENEIYAGISGAGKDFNLMVRRNEGRGHVEIVQGRKTFTVDAEFFAVFLPATLELHLIENEKGTEFTVNQDTNYLVIRVNKE